MSTFTPPTFAKFGSNTKNLFEKKYDLSKHSIKTIRRSANGITIETGATVDTPSNLLRGYLKGSYAQPKLNVDIDVNTDAKENSSASLKFNKLYPGLIVSATHNTTHKWSDSRKTNATIVDATYTKDAIAFTTELKSDLDVHHIKPSLAVGWDNFSFGLSTQLHANASGSEPNVLDYNLGFEYSQPQYTASLVTEKKLDWAISSLFYRYKPNHAVGAQLRLQVVGDHKNEIIVGNEYQLDKATTIKSKVQFPSQELSVAVEHQLGSPSLAFQFAAKYKPQSFGNGVKAEAFGIGLTFGDN